MEISVSRKAHFNAAHRLNIPSWSEEENKAFFGVCNNGNFHGHNYDLIVSITGEIDPITGYLTDMKWLGQVIKDKIEDRFDHKNLNLDCEEFKTLNPTTENIAVVIWNILRKEIPSHHQLKVTLYETERNFVEYNGN
ncbi:MAG: 6-carboxytetrahydropterin synthase [Bacteroidia bacterium]|nr:6-carboxytetrahydropterin synthase [Bacteroidia bacterium]MCF8425847.1 6-carboxytetrahydropterin synthase [Bacteroidia bacterium]MCF8445626.1 6-carboxytetrahydropterin synthase [Bacteroidia bacterium]